MRERYYLEIWNGRNAPTCLVGILHILGELPNTESKVDIGVLGGPRDARIKAIWRTSTHRWNAGRYTVIVNAY